MQNPEPDTNVKPQEISAIVVTFNDESHLEECLQALTFCQELIVIDLGSTDNSVKIAQTYTPFIHTHPWVPIADMIKQNAALLVANDWIIFMDPDMIFPKEAITEIRELIQTEANLAKIYLPYINLLKGMQIRHGVWGANKQFSAVINRNGVTFPPYVHTESEIKPGWISITLDNSKNIKPIKHYWIDSWNQFFEKHNRYLKLEGQSRHALGQRFSWNKALFFTAFEAYNTYIRKTGYKDGLNGVILGILWTWYNWKAWMSLKKYELSVRNFKVN